MERPTLSVLIPTIARPSLERTLRSLVLQQSSLTYEIVVVGDSHAGTWRSQLDTVLPRLSALIAECRVPLDRIAYHEFDGGEHCVGHPQRQYGMTVAKGRWLSWLSDDDLYLPGAFEAIRQGIAAAEMQALPDRPVPPVLLFRWISPWKTVYWHTPGIYGGGPGHIDAECIVASNIPEKLGKWGRRYQGDFDMVDSTIKLHGGKVVFRPEIIAQAQPADADDWTQHAGGAARRITLDAVGWWA